MTWNDIAQWIAIGVGFVGLYGRASKDDVISVLRCVYEARR